MKLHLFRNAAIRHLLTLLMIVVAMMGKGLAVAQVNTDLQPITAENSDQVVQLALIGRGIPSDVAVSPTTNTVAIATTIGVWFYNPENLDTLTMLPGSEGSIGNVIYSSEGNLLAYSNSDKLHLWDTNSEREVAVFSSSPAYIGDIAFSPDTTTIAAAVSDMTVLLWDVQTGDLIGTLVGHEATSLSSRIKAVAFSPDGKALASGGDDAIRIWDVKSQRQVITLTSQSDKAEGVNDLAFSPDGTQLVSVTYNDTVQIWELQSGRLIDVLDAHEKDVSSVEFSPNGSVFATGSSDGTVRLWSAQTRNQIGVWPLGNSNLGIEISFNSDGSILAATNPLMSDFRLWDVAEQTEITAIPFSAFSEGGLAFSPDNSLLALPRIRNTAVLVNLDSFSETPILSDVTGSPDFLVFDTNGALRAGYRPFPGDFALWDVQSHTKLGELPVPWGNPIALSPDGTLLASGGDESNDVRLWDINTFIEIPPLTGHEDSVNIVTFSTDGTRIASASKDRTIRIWDVQSRTENALIPYELESVRSVVFSPDGTLLAFAGDVRRSASDFDQNIHVVNLQTQAEVASYSIENTRGAVLAFNPNGELLAIGDSNSIIRLWDMNAGTEPIVLSGHTGSITNLAFYSDGTLLASGGVDGVVRLWGVKNPAG